MRATGITRVLLFFIFIASCSESNNRYGDFAVTVDIVTRHCDFDSVYMRYPYRVRLLDSAMYVMDLHADDYFCHAYEYPSMRHKKSFAKRGKGPDEIAICNNFLIDHKGGIYFLNGFGKKVYSYRSADDPIRLFAELPAEILYCNDFALYNDSTFIIPDYYGTCRFFLVDKHGNIFRKTGVIPTNEHTGKIPDAAMGHAWTAFIGYNPNNHIAALATQLGEVLEIYDLNTNKVIVKTGRDGQPKCKYKGSEAFPDGVMGYSDVVVGDHRIYALYWGHEIEKMVRGEITVQGGQYIHVFDLEGNPVKRYRLDRFITGLCVDEKRGEAIGTDVNEEQLVTFNLE